MSITRLQQARQMYATGQRVTKSLDGSRPGYRGDDAARSERSYSGTTSARADPGPGASYGDGPSSSDRQTNTREDNSPHATGDSPPLQRATNLDVKEQYAVGNPTTLDAPIAPPTVSPFLENVRNDNRIDAFNLQNATYQPPNLPFFIPGSNIIKTIGGLGFEKNKNFFLENVAGKYGFGYGMDAYKDYMRKRSLGEIQAYGRPLTAEELRNQVGGGDGGNNNTGIMTVNNTVSDDADGDGDVDQDDFVFRYFDKTGETLQAGAGGVQDLMTQIRKRISNIFS